ncbi:MAG TPA: NAD(P)-dependent oxidoreductase [Thermoleophilaceae bacterium]|jgi:3-hydroxyisobutyrate dehydrogenase-like beta-hydroxyacid dehydrogenase
MAEPVRRVAFLGLGIMGAPMARNVAAAGFEVTVWNRTASRAEGLGLPVAATPAEASASADLTITMVVDSPQVEEVLFGPDGSSEGMRDGHVAVDMSTIAPTAAIGIGERLASQGVAFLDAPVTGSRPKAEAATLTIMAGGEHEHFERAKPVLEAMGQLVVRVGPSGHGQMVKLINNTLAAINAAALAEGLTLAGGYGLDAEALLQVVAAGSGASAMLDLKARPMLDRDLDPLFKLEHMLKDVRHCLAEARALGVELPLAERAERLYAKAAESGLGERDFAAVIEALDDRK